VNDTQLVDYIKSKIDERCAEISQFVSRGTVEDYSEYQKLCGVIQGLAYAKELITDLAKKFEEDDDE
jgi:hypothetical protein